MSGLPPSMHPSGPGPVPLASTLSDRAGATNLSDEQAAAVDPLVRAIRTLDKVSGVVEPTLRTSAGSSRREEILDGAATLFAEHGYHGASLRDISRRVGISHPGMLHHFSSKDALLGAVIDRLENHAEGLMESMPRLAGSRELFLAAFRHAWNPRSHPIQLLSTLNSEAVSKDHPGRFRLARLRRVHEHVLEEIYTAFAERGELRPGVEPEFAARCTVAMVLSLAAREETVRTLQRADHDDSAAKDLDTLVGLFLVDPPAQG